MSVDKVFLARLVLLSDSSTELALKKALILHSDPSFAEAVVAIVGNVLHRVLIIEADQIRSLKPFRRAIHRLAEQKGRRGDKRKLLSQKRLLSGAAAVISVALPQLETEEWNPGTKSSLPSLPPASQTTEYNTLSHEQL
jgi:hypothetical protein